MRQEITLYLNGQQIDLNDNGGIYFNYKQKDVKNPTIVKNSFSKTLTIPGTDNNDNIFNNIWDLTRVQTTDIVPYFNQSKRVPFELFLNGELIEQGYCKLDRIRRDKVNEYDLSLFGGLGDFFYSLAYNAETGNKRTLADLEWDTTGFTINKETVKENWDELASGETPTIAFAPMYNGVPEKLDASKVTVNVSGYTGDVRVNDGTGVWSDVEGFPASKGEYSTFARYALIDLPEPTTEWRTRDLRSWGQRPALSVKSLFTAISNPETNGGYEVSLDGEFFNNQNPYYEQAYITLPQITQLNLNKEESVETITVDVISSHGSSTGTTYVELVPSASADELDLSVRLIAAPLTATNADRLYTSIYCRGGSLQAVRWMGGFGMQLIGLDSNNNEVAGSNVCWLTTQLDPGVFLRFEDVKVGIDGSRTFRFYDRVDTIFGSFKKVENQQYYVWDSLTVPQFKLKTNTKIERYLIKIVPGCTMKSISSKYNYFNGNVWITTRISSDDDLIDNNVVCAFNNTVQNAEIATTNEINSYSDVTVNLQDLLNTQNTPADYLISYCKLFNLYFDRDVIKKKVNILTSKNFYDKDVDLEDRLDDNDYDEAWKPYGYDRHIEIEPLSFEHKWYSFNYKQNNTETLDNYKAKYGVDFGQQRVNTGYEFDSETEELLKDNIFVNASQVLEVNKDYIKRTSNQVDSPAFLTDNVTYHLFNTAMDKIDIEIGKPTNSFQTNINRNSSSTIKYDAFSKVQVHNQGKPTDGSNILIFFNGMKETNVDYWITDDLIYMQEINENPTWLYTATEYDALGNHIAIKTNELPQFSRYIDDDEYIYASWDFGRTKELFVPGLNYIDGNATLYERYWRNYIQDLYDIDTRIVTAHIQFDEKPTKESLKHFYYFEGSYWVIDEIIDYNPTSYELTKVKFVKVNDKANYLNNNIVPPGPGPEPPVVKQFEFNPEGIMVTAGSGSTSTTLLVSGYEVVEWTIPTPTWATITRNGNTVSISYEANPDTTNRSFSIGVAGRDGSETVTTVYNFIQKGVPYTVSITAPSPIAATATTLTYTVTANGDVSVELLPDHTINRHSSGTSIGNFTIPANTAATANHYTLLASIVDNPSVTASTTVTQAGNVRITGITLSSTWATDVSWTGGTATYQNCNNVVIAHYNNGTDEDVTAYVDWSLSTSLNVPSTTSTTRDSVGVINVIAAYYDYDYSPNPFTSTVVVTAYQEAAGTPPTPPTGQTWTESNAGDYEIYGNLIDGSGNTFAGVELDPRDDDVMTNELPQTIAEVWLAVYGLDVPANYEVWVYNGRTGAEIIASHNGSDFVGTGSIEIREDDYINFVVRTKTRSRAQVEPEPDETENEEEDSK